VRVHAAALTRDELEWPVDRLPAIPSYELSGIVAALGRRRLTGAPRVDFTQWPGLAWWGQAARSRSALRPAVSR
jgi:hypothetical protein